MNEVTCILKLIESGDTQAPATLLPLVYEELRRLAAQKMVNESRGQTLQATALVHEAYVRLVDRNEAQSWSHRGHFFAAAAEAMRRILVDNARRKRRIKHGGGWNRIDLPEVEIFDDALNKHEQLIELDDALDKLAEEDPSSAEVVKLHFFGGLSLEVVAELLGISRATTYRHWAYARSWLKLELRKNGE